MGSADRLLEVRAIGEHPGCAADAPGDRPHERVPTVRAPGRGLRCHPELDGLSAGAVHRERDHLVDETAALTGGQAISVEDQPQLAAAAGEIGQPEPFRDVVIVQLRVQPGRLG